MNAPEHFMVEGELGVFRPIGAVTLPEAVQMISSAIAFAREQHLPKLLVVPIGPARFKPPDTFERYDLVHEWARAAMGVVRVAVVMKPEYINQRKFGPTIAANLGFTLNLLPSEEEARRWLEASGETGGSETKGRTDGGDEGHESTVPKS